MIKYQRIMFYKNNIYPPIMADLKGTLMDNQNDKDQSENKSFDSTPSQEEEYNNKFTEKDDQLQEEKNGESELDSSGQWVKEILDNPDEENDAVLEDLNNLPVKQGDLPEWINTLSQAGEDTQISEENIEPEQEPSDAIHFKSLDDSWDIEEATDKSVGDEESEIIDENIQPDEGFVEISQYDLEASDNLDVGEPEVDLPGEDQEELPDWLEEMIEEPEAENTENIEFVEEIFNSDEPTKPVIVTINETEEESIVEEQPFESTPVTTDLSLQEEEQPIIDEEEQVWEFEEEEYMVDGEVPVGEFGEEERFSDEFFKEMPTTEEEILPIDVPYEDEIFIEETTPIENEDVEEFTSEEDDWQKEDLQSIGLPKTLKFAKYLLDQGEIEPAFEIFQTYVKKSEYLEEIKIWANDAVMTDEGKSNLLWELIGDLALKQDQPGEALSAYTRAISVLIR